MGVTMFELITGDVPFGDHGGILLEKGAEVPTLDGYCSEELAGIIMECLEKEAWNRPAAEAVKAHCVPHLEGELPGNSPSRKERPKVVESKGAGRATSPYGNEHKGHTKRSQQRNVPPPVPPPPPAGAGNWEAEPPYPPIWEDGWRQAPPPFPPRKKGKGKNTTLVWMATLLVCVLAAAAFIVLYSRP